MPLSNIFLIGFMGAGKSSLGKRLSKKLDKNFIDTDTYIESFVGKSITEIIECDGIDKFRQIEHIIIKDISSQGNTVFATGGGLPCYNNNIEIINKNGISIYLQFTPGELLNRLTYSKKERPLIKGMKKNDLYFFIKNTLIERENFYLQAHYSVNGINLKIDNILKLLNKKTDGTT